MAEQGQIERADQQDWRPPSAEAKLTISVTKFCETSGFVKGSEKVVQDVARNGSLAVSGLAVGAILWVGFAYDHAIMGFVAAVIFFAGVVWTARGRAKA